MSPITSPLLVMPTPPNRHSFIAAITSLGSISPFPMASHLTIKGSPAVTMLSDTAIAGLPEPWPPSYMAMACRCLPPSSGSTGV